MAALPSSRLLPATAIAAALSIGATDAAAQQAGVETTSPQAESPARTPLPDMPKGPMPKWTKHVEIGGDVAIVTRLSRPSSGDQGQQGVSYSPTVGFGIHAGWEIFRYLRFQGYFIDARHDVTLPKGSALGLPGEASMPSVYTYAFGARLSPTLPLGERARTWITGGIGWGRFEFDKMEVTVSAEKTFTVRERSNTFLEVPLGIGTSFDIVKGVPGLSIQLEVTGAYVDFETGGTAVNRFQAIDTDGKRTPVGAFPDVTSSFVQTLGLSLVL